MIQEETTNGMFDEHFDIRINTVNCVGVMGKGIALEFKKRYPKMFREYRKLCLKNELKPGDIFVWNKDGEHIINVATKDHWRDGSKYDYVRKGIKNIYAYLNKFTGLKIAVPALGCGNGGLDWNIVSNMIMESFSDLNNIEIKIFSPLKPYEYNKEAVMEQNQNQPNR